MTRKPDVLNTTTTANDVELELRIPGDLVYTEGHFEEEPIVPGVVLLDWALEKAMDRLEDVSGPVEIKGLKFKEPLLPGDTCTLRISMDPDGNHVSFEYVEDGSTVAEGRCVMNGSTHD